MVENWIIDPAARVRFPSKSWDFFQPNLLCFVLCYGFRVIRQENTGKQQEDSEDNESKGGLEVLGVRRFKLA